MLQQQLEEWVNMSEVKVNTIKKYDGSSITIGESGDTITVTAGASLSGSGSGLTTLNATQLTSGTLPDARFPATLPAISGANLTNLPAETKPTVTSVTPSTIENTATDVVVGGTNFVSVPTVDAISTTGAIIFV